MNNDCDNDPKTWFEMLAALAHDFRCTDPADMKLKPLADRMNYLKNTEEGRAELSSVIEQRARQAVEDERKKVARKLLDTGKVTLKEIAGLTGLSFDEVQTICGPGKA